MNTIVENYGGLSSNGEWLAGSINAVAIDNRGTLPQNRLHTFHVILC